MYWVTGTTVTPQEGVGRGGFYSPMRYSQSFAEPGPGTMNFASVSVLSFHPLGGIGWLGTWSWVSLSSPWEAQAPSSWVFPSPPTLRLCLIKPWWGGCVAQQFLQTAGLVESPGLQPIEKQDLPLPCLEARGHFAQILCGRTW